MICLVSVQSVALRALLKIGTMQARNRKLIGTVLLLIFLAVYVTAAVMIGANHVVAAPAWAEFAYFLAAGLLWVIPGALLIKWMQRPDPLKRR